ncbi:MAG: C25 family cysteine peptidase, partial [Bacteroidales bacterium]|nr:C25 family cysteine peptidase [Bacteroidales bacterium]
RWKTQKGFRINVLYRGTGLAGNTYTQLRDTLVRIYRSATPSDPPPEYLLIVGDVGRIPYYGTGNITDLYYGEYDGDGDYIPEVYIGRIPVSDTTELKSVVRKIIQYEKFEFEESNKFHANALTFAGDEPAYANTMNGQVKYAVTNYLIKPNNINERHFYYPHSNLSVTKDSVIALINSGLSFINYTGHGDANGLLHVNIKTPDLASLSNSGKYPFFISNACRTGQFNLPASFGNRMVLSVDKGSIGFIGCSNDSYWDEDFYWSVGVGQITQDPSYYSTGLGALDRLFHTHSEKASEWYYTMGQVNFAGNLSVGASTSKWKKYYWETYNLIGDPSLIPIIGTPKKFTVTVPDTLPNGIKSFTMSVDPFAYVAVSRNDTLWDASFAGPSGSVQLELPGASNSHCLFVISGQNRYPVIKTVYFSNIKKEYISLSGNSVNDSKGNNNGRADFGETFYFSIKISNLGQEDAAGAYAMIRTDSDWAEILSDSVFIGGIEAGSETEITDRLELKVRSDVPDLGYIPVTLTIKTLKSEKKYSVDIPVHAPELKIMNCIIDDRASGNGDLVADPGETFYLVFKIANSGTSTTSGQFSLTSLLPNLTIIEPDVKSGDLTFGQTSDIRILVSLSESTLSGDYFSVSAILNCSPYQLAKEFDFRAGKIRESFEAPGFNVFPWINTSPVPWIVTEKTAFEGNLSARSGAISNSAVTTLRIKTVYEKADSLRFYYRVSSEPNYDYLAFRLNDKELLRKSGEVPWSRKAVYVQPGINILEWSYKKDNSVFLGSDCAWIDLIDFASTSPVRYIGKDIQVSGLESPELKDKYGKETITVRVRNHGIATQKGFTLAYSINGGSPVRQL